MKHERSERQIRIDKLLVDRGLAESRTKAQALVMAGVVLADEQRVNKPSDTVASDAHIRLKGGDDPTSRYVGRGGLKLETALRDFKLSVLTLAPPPAASPIACCNTELSTLLPSTLVTTK